jgi:hypothetical protein
MSQLLKPTILRKDLEAMPKHRLVKIIRDMDSYLCVAAESCDELSWRGDAEKQQRFFTRSHTFNEAAGTLHHLAAPKPEREVI